MNISITCYIQEVSCVFFIIKNFLELFVDEKVARILYINLQSLFHILISLNMETENRALVGFDMLHEICEKHKKANVL